MPIMIPNNNLPPGTLRGVYASLLLGQVAIGAILYFLSSQSTTEQAPASVMTGLQTWQLVACALLLFAVLTAAYLRGRLVQSATRPDGQKVATTALVAWALMEGANLATVILAYRHNDTSLYLAFVVGLLAFVWLRPATWPLEAEA
ncbi:MAG: hypothetical protein D6818_03800 [Bacteroidetes bacterium]|nr:MAG: hypothetical protein D6818_03800 [Bacteroidota bacterium]